MERQKEHESGHNSRSLLFGLWSRVTRRTATQNYLSNFVFLVRRHVVSEKWSARILICGVLGETT
jgi:hypothetical protein